MGLEYCAVMGVDQDQDPAIARLTGTFANRSEESSFLAHSWPVYARSLRIPLILVALLILVGLYLDNMWYGLSSHFFAFSAFRVAVAGAILLVCWLTFSPHKPQRFDLIIGVVQLFILSFWFGIFYDRVFLNPANITSESFFTILFVTYPLLVFYVIRGNILFSLCNSILSVLTYVVVIVLIPDIALQNRITELLVFIFFVYYSYTLQQTLNTEERMRFSYEKRQEDALALAKKESEEKSRFIAATSHDLRQPLHALSLYIDMLDNKWETGKSLSESETAEIVHYAKASLTSLNELLTALLDISKLDAKAIEFVQRNISASTLLDRVEANFKQLAIARNVALRIRSSDLMLSTDPVMLERALSNLLSNAIKYSDGTPVLVACRKRGRNASIEVRDLGPGIPETEIDNVFSEYYQLSGHPGARPTGLGLGLAIVKRICDALNYRLRVRSKPGSGTLFAIEVPLGEALPETESERPDELSALSLNGKTILVIDDEQEVQFALSTLLTNWGCKVVVAGSREKLFNELVPGARPDAIISDYHLPNGTYGIEVIKEIRRYFDAAIPALLVTGDTAIQRSAYPDIENLSILYKPLKATQLRLALAHTID